MELIPMLLHLSDGQTLLTLVQGTSLFKMFVNSNLDFRVCPDSTYCTVARNVTFDPAGVPTLTKTLLWDDQDKGVIPVCVQQIVYMMPMPVELQAAYLQSTGLSRLPTTSSDVGTVRSVTP